MNQKSTPLTGDASPRPLLDKTAVARVLAISPRQLDRLVASGAFPRGLRVGNRQRWRQEALEAYLEGLERAIH